jgi:hypothetical protein
MELQAGDIFVTRGHTVLGRLIRFFSRSVGEDKSRVNHTGIIVDGAADDPIIVEALHTVKRYGIYSKYSGTSDDIAIFRPLNLTNEERAAIIQKAESYVGLKYGYLKIGAHFGDWVLNRITRKELHFFRRAMKMDRYPICSWVVAKSYEAGGKTFGVKPGDATPDDIWDFCLENPDKFQFLRELTTLNKTK